MKDCQRELRSYLSIGSSKLSEIAALLGCACVSLFFSDLRPVKFVTIWTYLIAGTVFAIQPTVTGDPVMDYLLRGLHSWQWALAFFTVAAVRCARILAVYDNHCSRLFAPLLGIWLWSMLFVISFILAPDKGMSKLYGVCIMIEVWVLSQYLTNRMDGVKDHGA